MQATFMSDLNFHSSLLPSCLYFWSYTHTEKSILLSAVKYYFKNINYVMSFSIKFTVLFLSHVKCISNVLPGIPSPSWLTSSCLSQFPSTMTLAQYSSATLVFSLFLTMPNLLFPEGLLRACSLLSHGL